MFTFPGFGPFEKWLVEEALLDWFPATCGCELLVIGWRLRSRLLRARTASARSKWRLERSAAEDPSGVWILPIYCWGLEAIGVLEALWHSGDGLADPPRSVVLSWFFSIFLVLAMLAIVQMLAVMATGGPALTLGVSGKTATAAIATILAVMLHGATWAALPAWFGS